MSPITRRDLLCSGVALSASSLIAQSAWARAAALLAASPQAASAGALAAVAPREQLLFDFGWKFQFGNGCDPSKDLDFAINQDAFAKTGDFKFARVGYDDSKWRSLNLPHDWAVELPFVRDDELQSHGYKPLGRRYPETSIGWYRREFDIPASDAGRRIAVEFDGAFRDILLLVNGCFIGFTKQIPKCSTSLSRRCAWTMRTDGPALRLGACGITRVGFSQENITCPVRVS